jgi:hypothetical protein
VNRLGYFELRHLFGEDIPEPVLRRSRPWLTHELVATEAAQHRLRAWVARGGFERDDDVVEERRALVARVPVVGDRKLRPLVAAALAQMPAPVVDHLAKHSVIITGGRSIGGFSANEVSRPADAVEPRRRWILAVDAEDEEFRARVAHECAHTWLTPADSLPDLTPDVVEQLADGILALAVEDHRLDEVIADYVRDERMACRLAASWGFVGRGADAEACTRAYRRVLPVRAAAAHAEHFPPPPSGDAA